MKRTAIFALALVVAGVAGFMLQRYLTPESDTDPRSTAIEAASSAAVGSTRPEFAMIDINGDMRNISDWEGQVILLNFWATWCTPCLREIPHFIEVQQQLESHGFQIVGIAVDDQDAVREFVDEMSINYPIMAGEVEAIELSKKYGNSIGGLPYTAFIDRNGIITHTITGELSEERLISILRELGLSL